jgi:ABC-2 type transport system ATP-binding protein
MVAAIEMADLGKRYRGATALTGLSLEVPAGSIFGFLGPNGAGKTTALKILAGLTRATSGTAAINGVPVTTQGAHRAQIGYLAQEPRFYGWMSGRQTLAYVSSFYAPAGGRARLDELLARVGLADAADRPTGAYSGGMRQRLGIAQALVGDPPVLLLDEPAAALDPLGRHDVLEIMRQLRGDKTIFYSTHILDDVERVSDHVAIVDQGRLVVSAPTVDLVQASASGTLQVVLLGATETTEAALAALPGVARASWTGRQGDEWRYDIAVHEGETAAVQRAVTHLAAAAGLTVVSNRQEAIGLEDVFLRIVDKERAA